MQTAIIITTNHHELLVRTFDCHIPATKIAVDWRSNGTMLSERWSPIAPDRVEVRHEGDRSSLSERDRNLDVLRSYLRRAVNDGVLQEAEMEAGLTILDHLAAER